MQYRETGRGSDGSDGSDGVIHLTGSSPASDEPSALQTNSVTVVRSVSAALLEEARRCPERRETANSLTCNNQDKEHVRTRPASPTHAYGTSARKYIDRVITK